MCVYCTLGDEAFGTFESWVGMVAKDTDPGLVAVHSPPVGFVTAATLMEQLLCVHEANMIVEQYSHLRARDFAAAPHPALKAMAVRALPIRYHHATYATSAVTVRISNPALGECGAAFPTILAQAPGTYLCTLMQQWRGKNVHIHILRS